MPRLLSDLMQDVSISRMWETLWTPLSHRMRVVAANERCIIVKKTTTN